MRDIKNEDAIAKSAWSMSAPPCFDLLLQSFDNNTLDKLECNEVDVNE